ncbi:MAG: alpha/beta hydrolase [Oscillospiraceae bacterium]|jgi:pimeloyl-ACP methyl ester carboxylesterase|nr:alpha/beta hydrolase [Oscillospiraceae bacterium]
MKTTRCVISAILAITMVLLCLAPASAKRDEEIVPLIIVNGMGESDLLKNMGTSDETVAFPPASDAIAEAVFRAAPYLLSRAAIGDLDGFAAKVSPILRELFDDIAFLPDGTPKHQIDQLKFPDSYANDKTGKIDSVSHGKIARAYGAEISYQFVHDWRNSAIVEAQNLNEMIERVLQEQGAQKVKLMGVSMGGGVVTAYLAKYGYARVERVVMMSSVFRGLPIVGDLFNGRLTLDSATLQRFLAQTLAGSEPWDAIVGGLLDAFQKIGLLDFVLDNSESLVQAMMPTLNSDFIVPIFGQLPGFWGLIPDEDYESAKALLLNGETHADLIKLIDDHHYNVFNKAPALIKKMVADGIQFDILSNYNLAGYPIGPHADMQSDDGLLTYCTSAGAVCAPLGKTLGGDYIQKIADGYNRLSPDGIIDASTCLLPETTWFTKDLHHVAFYSEESVAFVLWLLQSGKHDVRSNAKYPQFMQYDSTTEKMLPLGGGESLLVDASASVFPETGDDLPGFIKTCLFGM